MKERGSPEGLRDRRKVQNKIVEKEIHGVFRGRERTPADKATDGLTLLANKMSSDLQEQFDEIMIKKNSASYDEADREIARLLRMLEKRKMMLDQLQEAFEMDDILAAAAPILMRGSDAQN